MENKLGKNYGFLVHNKVLTAAKLKFGTRARNFIRRLLGQPEFKVFFPRPTNPKGEVNEHRRN